MIRPLEDGSAGARRRLARLAARGSGPGDVESAVRAILDDVRRRGDAAVADYTRRFDGVSLKASAFEVSRREIGAARARVPGPTLAALEAAHERISTFHQLQREEGFERREPGLTTGVRITPMRRAGVYVPGGKAAYPSSVLMNVVPARVAGVDEIVVVTPPSAGGIRDEVLAAASIAGADRVLRIGGAQAVAALAYGTKSVPRVDKIVGPGNIFVATAKRLVFGQVDIDMVAGPSEVLVLADASADAEFIAADMLAQAEHDELAAAICVTTSARLAEAVAAAVDRQLRELARAPIARASLARYGTILVARNMRRAAALADEIAPEHLEIFAKKPREILPLLRNAGAIFLGEFAAESLGDYAAGPNHVLPTGGAARVSAPRGGYDLVKRTSIIEAAPRGLARLADTVTRLAEAEGLEAHALAVTRRLARPRR